MSTDPGVAAEQYGPGQGLRASPLLLTRVDPATDSRFPAPLYPAEVEEAWEEAGSLRWPLGATDPRVLGDRAPDRGGPLHAGSRRAFTTRIRSPVLMTEFQMDF